MDARAIIDSCIASNQSPSLAIDLAALYDRSCCDILNSYEQKTSLFVVIYADRITKSAIKYENLNMFRWLHHRHECIITASNVCAMLRQNFFEAIDWIIEEHLYDFSNLHINTNVYDCTISVDAIVRILDYLMERDLHTSLRPRYFMSRASATGKDHLPILNWFGDRADEFDLSCVSKAIDITRSTVILDWWYHKHTLGLEFKYTTAAFNLAICTMNRPVMQWWMDHADEFEIKFDPNDMCNLLIDSIEYLLMEQTVLQIKMPSNIIDNTCSMALINWMWDHRDSFGFIYSASAMDYGNIDKLNWFWDKRDELELKYTHESINRVLRDSRTREVEFWYDRRLDLKLKFTPEVLIEYVNRNLDVRSKYLELLN
jgi:hypothetical protein